MTIRIGKAAQAFMLLATLVAALSAGKAHAWTLLGRDWAGRATIPVYLDPALPTAMRHNDGTAWTNSELEGEIRFLLQVISQDSEANLPYFYYAGFRTSCSGTGCRIAYALVITAAAIPPSGGCQPQVDSYGTPISTGVLMYMPNVTWTAFCSPLPTWEHVWVSAGFITTTTLMHELGHVLGLGHSDAPLCSAPPCAVMDTTAEINPHSYYGDDVNGLRAIYGPVNLSVRTHEESTDGATWTALGAPPVTGTHFSLSSSSALTMFVLDHNASAVRARTWHWWDFAWDQRSAPANSTPGRLGAAFDASTGWAYEANLSGESYTNVEKYWSFVRHSADFATYYNMPWTSGSTRRNGETAAVDPRTGQVIQVWQDTSLRMQIQAVKSNGDHSGPWPVIDSVWGQARSFGSPAVACGDASIALNCVVVWAAPVMPGDANKAHLLLWKHFSMNYSPPNIWSVTQGPTMSSVYIMQGLPTVAYRGPATSSSAFSIGWQTEYAGTSYVWTVWKGSAPDVQITSLQQHGAGVSNRRFFIELGASNSSSELIYARQP